MLYCKRNLGDPIGKGTSRIVFQVTDYQVLKLALNQKGIAQNEYEGRYDSYKSGLDIFPEVYKKAEDNSWLLSEYVLPAKPEDFKHCIGISFKTWTKVVEKMGQDTRYSRYNIPTGITDEQLIDLVENYPFVEEVYDFIGSYTDVPIGDMMRIANYGLAKRGGQAHIVLLDSGINEEIFNKYYRKG